MASNTNHFLDGPGLSRVWSKIKSFVKGTSSLVGAQNTIGTVKNGSSITNVSDHAPCPIVNGIPYYKNTDTTYRVTSDSWQNDGLMSYNHYTYLKRSFCAVNRSGVSLTFTPNEGTPTTVTMPNAGTNTSGVVKTTSTVSSASGYTACPIISGVPYYKDTNTTYSTVGALNTTGLVKNGSSVTSASGYTPCPIIGGVPYYQYSLVGAQNTTGIVKNGSSVTSVATGYTACPIVGGVPYYRSQVATASASGWMSAAHFSKLDGIGTRTNALTGSSFTVSKSPSSSWSGVSLSSGTSGWQNLAAGTWLLIARAKFPNTANNRVGLCIVRAMSGDDADGVAIRKDAHDADVNGDTYCEVVALVTHTSATSYGVSLYCNRTSTGNAVNVSCTYTGVRIA